MARRMGEEDGEKKEGRDLVRHETVGLLGVQSMPTMCKNSYFVWSAMEMH